jgi:hypothetical protein
MVYLAERYGIYILAVLFTILVLPACYAIEFRCPASIEVSEQLQSEQPGWESLVDQTRGGYRLDNVGFYNGHPKEKGAVVPDKTTRSKSIAKTVWRFPGKKSATSWLACSYANTSVMLVRQLPDGLSYCEMTSELLPSGSVLRIKSVVCE